MYRGLHTMTVRTFIFINGSSMNSKLIDLNELSAMLGRSPETIKKDLKRNRLAVPPRLYIPGTRLLRWRQIDVDRWLAGHVDVHFGPKNDREVEAERRFTADTGMTLTGS